MKTIKVLKLGTVCTDKATELEGTLTHWICDLGGHIDYLFQPKGLNEEDQPVKKLYLELDRLTVKPEDFEEVEVPMEILSSQVTDKASSFTGMAVGFIRHINGCFHVQIQPKGVNKKNNSPILKNEFDLRGCEGKMIPILSASEKKDSEKKEPSPTEDDFKKPFPTNEM